MREEETEVSYQTAVWWPEGVYGALHSFSEEDRAKDDLERWKALKHNNPASRGAEIHMFRVTRTTKRERLA